MRLSSATKPAFSRFSKIVAITFSLVSIFISNQFAANCLILSLLIECFMISPFAYRITGQKYDNYKDYLNN